MKKTCRAIFGVCLLVAMGLLMLSSTGVTAAESANVAALNQVAEVEISGVVVARFSQCYLGITPYERAAIVYRRIWDLLYDYRPNYEDVAASVRVEKIKGDYVIMAKDRLIITIDPLHAQANKVAPWELAQIWAHNLQISLQHYAKVNKPIPTL